MKAIRHALPIAAGLVGLALLLAAPAAADQVILDDLIVDGSACIGLDCVNGESFGFDTIRIKENNLRIKAQDTSTSASFPSNDWQITFNESSNGGANKFSIDDIDGGRTPFTIEAGAPSHSLYVDDGGRLGFGTSTPTVELHVKDGDTPTLRLEQDGSSGFTPQTWDVAGNESNFFIRDATNGSRLPFKIRPAASSNALVIDPDGDIGMGTASPTANFELHMLRTNAAGLNARFENSNATAQAVTLDLNNSSGEWRFRANNDGTFQIIDNDVSITRVSIGGGGLVTLDQGLVIGGTCSDSDGGDGGVDGCDRVFAPDYPLPSIEEHAAQMWEKGFLPAVGPTPDGEKISMNVFSKTAGILNELEKAHIYIEQLHQAIQGLEGRLAELEGGAGE